MRIKIALWLPRTADSVAVARQSVDRLLAAFGVRTDCREEIALAVTEACSNAVRHASGPPVYELAAESEDSECVITVNDDGPGLPSTALEATMPSPATLSGRGLALMKISTDGLEMRRRRSGGLSVRMLKRLRWTDGALGSLEP
jgi:serine/threonine-protein kinase RsbW